MNIKRFLVNWSWNDFTGEEQSAIAVEIERRIRNTVSMLAMSRAVDAMQQLEGRRLGERDNIEIKFSIEFLWTDVLEVFAGIREKSKKGG